MLLCHCITSLRNKQITVAKSAIELNLANAEASVTGINMLSSMGLSVMYQIVCNNLQKIETEHKRSCQQLFVLNIDDYHDLHESCQPNAISLSRIAHMATLLINTSSNIAPISFFSINNYSVHNPNEVFGKKRNLAAKPKPWKINLLLYLANTEWNLVKDLIFLRFTQSKNVGYRTFIDLLDNLIPSTLDVYSNLFRGNHFEEYLETIFRLWTVMLRSQPFISDIQYWRNYQHPIINLLKTELRILDEYPVENFHSLKLWINKEKWSVKIEGKKIKKEIYFFSPLTKGFSKGALPSGYHTSHPPNQDIFSCGHAYHDQCFINMGLKCIYYLEYFYSEIEKLSKSYNERLEMNINLEEFEEPTQKNEEDELSDDTDEFQNNNTIDEGLTKAILEFSKKTSKIQTHPVFQDITNIII
ncbi:hypothetical protein GLOIN_2v1867591 [Rhizophagus irregularis DAOM 181602=DAOM 197198]|uniref:Uncharacterized protein n=1 Tax=Rhizophagus irregularis (strain DAOM 181602 / DAOM 197198 / MUCL 43194) TaxID=747089 RepID=A0A2P4QWW4_RHIID|nr:hypothetical protein GLOIN_2v1867591 [Rhizophagus irregularis DAOM 181602=DAOM 197198]POG82161.1 hypothetical protein GLOIN_2v1867591 [Rhizophagus irregularis DAOM 181602=DAOM 197198]|eukprot:XP_025189027.1 hypothetical protein GLOIN_2v1867591 [Rhizophagus irregularis DAOM 181602=DAOM 197198]